MTTWKSNIPNVRRLERQKAEQYVMFLAFQVEALAKVFAPAMTGFLRNSIQTERTGPLSAMVFAGAWYLLFIELGTRHKSARPFLLPALNQVATQFGGSVQKWF